MATSLLIPEPTVQATEVRIHSGVRARAFLVGLPLLVLLCGLSVYADMVSQVVQFGVLQLAPPAVAALFGLTLANRFLARLVRRELLSHADLLVIYAMLVVGVMVSTRGVIEKLIPPLAYLPYYATRENGLAASITQHLPAWAMPFTPSAAVGNAPEAIRNYFEGNGGAVPWSVWIGPLVAWFGLIVCVIWTFACLATLLRRQWADNEQLRFPLTTLPLAIIRDQSEGQPFFSNRTMWVGFAIAFVVFGMNGLRANLPEWPGFVTDTNLGPYLSERPWNAIGYLPAFISLAAIGFAFFLPLDLLFSLWFFFLLTCFQDVVAVQMGGVPTGIGTHNARVFTGYQAAGAYVVLILAQLRIARPYSKQVWQTAFGREKPLDDSGELMPYRTAIIGLCTGFGGIILWLALAGMNPIVAAAQMGIYIFVIALVLSRGVAEGGILMTETSFLPSHLMSLVAPLPQLGATNLSMLALTNIVFTRDLRGVLLSPFLDDQKMAGVLGVKPRSLGLPLAVSVVVAFVVASFVFLKLGYTNGALTFYSYPSNNAANLFNIGSAQIAGSAAPPDATAYGGFALGAAVTFVLTLARNAFSSFPLHPLAYAIAPTWTMTVLWFPCLVAWIIKSTVMRFGGIDTFRKMAPLMLGLILGEFCSAVFWALGNITRGWNAPAFPWP